MSKTKANNVPKYSSHMDNLFLLIEILSRLAILFDIVTSIKNCPWITSMGFTIIIYDLERVHTNAQCASFGIFFLIGRN